MKFNIFIVFYGFGGFALSILFYILLYFIILQKNYKPIIITETTFFIIHAFSHLLTILLNPGIPGRQFYNKKSINIVTKDIVYPGINPGHDGSLTRGLDLADLNDNRKLIFWSVGYFNSLELIKDKQERYAIIDGLRHYHKSLFDLFKTVVVKNKVLYNNYKPNLLKIYNKFNWKQKFKFLFAFCLINLSFKNYSFYEIRSKEQWKEYFRRVDEQKYLDKLAKRLKNKKVVLYGAGIISELLFENYDLSKFNIIGVCDKRFERTDEPEFMGYKTIKPSELDAISYDSFLVTLKLFGEIKKSLKESKVNKKMYSAIKKDLKYPIRT